MNRSGSTTRAVFLDGSMGMLLIAALAAVHFSHSSIARPLSEEREAVASTLPTQVPPLNTSPLLPANVPPIVTEPPEPIAVAAPSPLELSLRESPSALSGLVKEPQTKQSEPVEKAPLPIPETAPPTQNPPSEMVAVQRREPAAVVEKLIEEPGLNKFGNLEGEQYGLGRTGEFKGARLLVWSAEPYVQENIFTADNPLWTALKGKGFDVQIAYGRFQRSWLTQCDQLWILAAEEGDLQGVDEQAIISFVAAGGGLYLCAENDPYVADVTNLVTTMFHTRVTGDYQGENILAVRGHGVTREDYLKARQKGSASQMASRVIDTQIEAVIARTTHYVDEHPLVTDVNFMYEGITLSHIEPSLQLQVVLTASNGQALAAVARDARLRVVVDCGFTRYYYPANGMDRYVTETAGTLRYAENIAAYLMYKDQKTSNGSRWREKRELVNKYKTADRTAILAGLNHADPIERWATIVGACRRLDNVSPLIERLQDSDSEVRAAAHRALVDLADGADFGPKVDGDPHVRTVAVSEWNRWRITKSFHSMMTKGRTEVVANALKSADVDQRWAAVMAIRQRKLPLVDELCNAVGDPDPAVQQEARLALKDRSHSKDFGPESGASIEVATIAAENWRVWWSQEQEDAAARALRLAKPAWETNPSAGRSRLQKIAKEYPKTEAGREAQSLLDK